MAVVRQLRQLSRHSRQKVSHQLRFSINSSTHFAKTLSWDNCQVIVASTVESAVNKILTRTFALARVLFILLIRRVWQLYKQRGRLD